MKTAAKVLLIVAIVLITIGLALSIFSGIFFGGSIRNFIQDARQESRQSTIQMAGYEVKTINVDITNAKITIKSTTESKATITYSKFDDERIDETASGGVLSIEETGNTFFNFLSWFRNRDHTVEIAIPEACMASINIHLVNGSINGSSFDCTDLLVSQTNGTISLSSIESKKGISIDTVNVGINLDDAIAANEIRCKSVNGQINNGTLNSKYVFCETVNGKISVDKIVADGVLCKTVNGNMKAGIVGNSKEFSIKYSSVNGTLTVDNQSLGKSVTMAGTGGKSAEFNSVNGSAVVSFID